jgi:hypothetical protein
MNTARTRIGLDGLVAGMIGYVTVVVFFVVLNLIHGRSVFHTAALLGAHLFYGLETPAELVIAPGPVLAFNGMHALLFLGAGLFMAWLAGLAERIPDGWYLVAVLFLIAMPHVFGLPIWFSETIQAEISLWSAVAASSLAAMAMGGYLLVVHPRLRAALRATGNEPSSIPSAARWSGGSGPPSP